MPIILAPSVSNLPAAAAPANAASNANNAQDQQQNDAASFGNVLNRSLANTDKPADSSNAKATDKTTDKTADRTARRPAGSADANQQDPAAALALAFIPLTPAASKAAADGSPLEAGKPLPSAAETQLNAAIAASAGKTAATAPAPAAPEATAQSVSPAAAAAAASTAAATAFGAQLGAQAAPATPAAATSKERPQIALQTKDLAAGDSTALAHANDKLLAPLTAPGGNAGHQQASQDDSHANQHSHHQPVEKSATQDRQQAQGSDKADVQRTAAAASTAPSSSEMAAGKTTVSTGSQFTVAASAQVNPAVSTVQAASNPASPAASPVSLPLTPTVGSGDWGPALGKQMIFMNNANHQIAELHLNPADLGPLKVTLTINDNQAQAMFVSAHQSVRDAVEAALPQLRSTLADNGISLGNTSVSADTQQQQQQSAFAQQTGGQSGSRGGQQRGDGLANLSGGVERSAAPVVGRSVLGVVDTFA